MTRETKIGLLVGLAFIIVIGILLSDHLTSATEPQGAQLAQVADSVRNGVAVPGAAQAAPPITQVAPPQNVAPQQTVLTKEELAPQPTPVEIVKIGGPQNATAPATSAPQPQQPPAAPTAKETSQPEPPITIVDATPPQSPPANLVDPSKNPLARVAEAFKEQLVQVGGEQQQQPQLSEPTIAAAALPPGARQYKAVAGDSVSRLAARFLGSDTKANRDAIVAVNPTLQKNPDIVVMGRTYVIPAAPTASVAPAQLPAQEPAVTTGPPVQIVQVPAPAPATPAPGESFYVVKAGDNLTKIAVEQLGSAAAVPAIMDLNRDALGGKDVIRPNMKLRLPAKPMAMAH